MHIMRKNGHTVRPAAEFFCDDDFDMDIWVTSVTDKSQIAIDVEMYGWSAINYDDRNVMLLPMPGY